MPDLISGLFTELCLFGGVILFALSFAQKFNKHKSKMLIVSVLLIAVGLIFFDTAAVSEAYQQGYEWGKSK